MSLRALSSRPLVYGPRGASARAPENTLRAFALALDEGADGIELDVRLSRDGVVVVAHDPTLDRVAGRSGLVAAIDAAELGRIDVGGDVVPTLDQVLDLALPRGALVNVELKGDVPDRRALVRATAALLARRSERERELLLCSSFRPEMLAGLRVLGCRVPRGFLFDAENTGLARAALLERLFPSEGVHPRTNLCTPASIRRWHARGRFVNAWTCDSAPRAQALARAGIDGIITNDPAGILAALGANARR